MQWKYWIPHVWDPPESRMAWADVLILPEDPGYTGDALCITVDAVLNDDAFSEADWREHRERAIARMGDADFFLDQDSQDLAVRAYDFSHKECLEWIARALRHEGLACSGFVAGTVDDFKGRSGLADTVDRLQALETEAHQRTDPQRQKKLAEIERCKRVGEAAYARMYDVRDRVELSIQTEVAMDAYHEVAKLARELGLEEEAKAAFDRVMHIKGVGRQLR